MKDSIDARAVLSLGGQDVTIYRLDAVDRAGLGPVERLPYSIRVLLECMLRHAGHGAVGPEHVEAVARWRPKPDDAVDVPFMPGRVVLQDFTGVPAVVDLAAMRDAIAALGSDPDKINPLVPTDLVIDHSVQVDHHASPDAFARNVELELARNGERYALLRWAQKAFRNFRVVPTGTGIVHQVNLEYLASVVRIVEQQGRAIAFPDTLVGTDSHTTMINGLGVVGWGVGGIEAEAVMLGQPYFMPLPEVVAMQLSGALRPGVTATDLVLAVTQQLRAHGVVGRFVEFCGPGLPSLGVADRATLANMAPEYGATMGYFPIDQQTIDYLSRTGRPPALVDAVERYTKEQLLWYSADAPAPEYSAMLELDLGTVEAALAGPRRPQDRVRLVDVPRSFAAAVDALRPKASAAAPAAAAPVPMPPAQLRDGSVVIAAITSCTNTSNPSVMIGAGLLARNAVRRGLERRPWVKTSLAPGSKVVTEYLKAADVMEPLEALGFDLVGYGCTTCIGNSGPLPDEVAREVQERKLVVAAVLSGNRNFEARIHSLVRANYLASPLLVVAYALAGRIDIDFEREPLGTDPAGQAVYLRDLWPPAEEIARVVASALRPELFSSQYASVFEGDERWRALPLARGEGGRFGWDPASTYVALPPYFVGMRIEPSAPAAIARARALLWLGDSVTTDHISPAGSIPVDGPAGRWLRERGVEPAAFNTLGSRRGHHEVMMRGTFGNVRIRNRLVPDREGNWSVHLPSGDVASVYEVAKRYQAEQTPLVVLAGKEYGTGSSRDWAAKGTALLGIRAVLAESFERIHRGNLVGMGVLPLELPARQSIESLGLDGREHFDLLGVADGELRPRGEARVVATGEGGRVVEFSARVRLDTAIDVEYYRHGGILQYVLRTLASS